MRNEVNRAHKAKTTLRYLLSLIAILSVVSVSAATFGTTYQRQYNRQTRGIRYENTCTQMPTLSMSTMNASMMKSGTTLPLAAATGVSVAEDSPTFNKGPRRMKMEDDEFENEEEPDVPINPFPLGDGIVPMMLMALAWVMVRMIRRKAAQ